MNMAGEKGATVGEWNEPIQYPKKRTSGIVNIIVLKEKCLNLSDFVMKVQFNDDLTRRSQNCRLANWKVYKFMT